MSNPVVPGTGAIVLAAGASRRMGKPKPLLQVDGQPLAGRIAACLRDAGVATVVLVTTEALQVHLSALPFPVLVNSDPEAGMLSSVQVGTTYLRQEVADAVLVCPCDLPLLTPAPVYAILNCWAVMFARDPAAIVVPVYRGKRGHPTLFGATFLPEITAMDSRQAGLNELLKRHTGQVREVAVTEEGVIQDADTPEEWERLLGIKPACREVG